MNQLTNIPSEVLFGALGAMLAAIYADIKYEVRRLRKESSERGTAIALLRQGFNGLCTHLKVPFHINGAKDNG